jgi:hypothetical protein
VRFSHQQPYFSQVKLFNNCAEGVNYPKTKSSE